MTDEEQQAEEGVYHGEACSKHVRNQLHSITRLWKKYEMAVVI